ncbi:MAG TPA: class I SAM-dependent methyltransferase [Gillisia sp.]|nr:class I SAM-dependent methyltransferase [Gillisia sp.]
MTDRKIHWETIYQTKKLTDVSWYQSKPTTSLKFIAELNLKKEAKIIDIGAGESFLADFLLADGFTDISILDISEETLDHTRLRLGEKAKNIEWIPVDISNFIPKQHYDLWHDRAVFHFLTEEKSIQNYLKTLENSINPGGYVILGTFSEKGPTKRSGLEIKQYSIDEMSSLLTDNFQKLHCENIDHITPSGAVQNFTFCSFQKKS